MTQTHLSTSGRTSWGLTIAGQTLFTVNPDIPAVEALEHASILQNCANHLMSEAAFGDPTGHAALSAVYLGEMAKAIMDDVAAGMSLTV